MNVFLIAALVLLAVQLGLLGLVAAFGIRLGYNLHQAICTVGMMLWFPIVTLSVIGAVSQ